MICILYCKTFTTRFYSSQSIMFERGERWNSKKKTSYLKFHSNGHRTQIHKNYPVPFLSLLASYTSLADVVARKGVKGLRVDAGHFCRRRKSGRFSFIDPPPRKSLLPPSTSSTFAFARARKTINSQVHLRFGTPSPCPLSLIPYVIGPSKTN